MFNLMRFKYLFFVISLAVILPGIFSLAKYGLKLSIDFTGGTLIEIKNQQNFVRTKPMEAAEAEKIYGKENILRFETVGPTIGKEMTQKALLSILVASLAIVGYIAYAFREIPHPYSSWKFGISAVIALLHDVLVLTGIFSILGHFYQVEVDALFITAILTVIGFSVHDTIVVFDRIRENLRKMPKTNFEEVVNVSLWQTMRRSVNTSLTALFVMAAIILFGGETIRHFALALFIGIFSGTYSSIFNAAPLLVIWERKEERGHSDR